MRQREETPSQSGVETHFDAHSRNSRVDIIGKETILGSRVRADHAQF